MKMEVPTEPEAPARFSMITFWPKRSDKLCATRRAAVSVGPPGGKATTILIIFGPLAGSLGRCQQAAGQGGATCQQGAAAAEGGWGCGASGVALHGFVSVV